MSKTVSSSKSKGPIRTEAVVPFLLTAALIWSYFFFLFDHNLASILEMVGYEVTGAEVNIRHLQTSFWRASFLAQGIELTDAEKPQNDMIKIGEVRCSLLWDGLLRARFVVNEMAVEQIEFNASRKVPGKVKPPEPPKPKSSAPSALEKEVSKVKSQTLNKVQDQYSENVFGDIAGILGGASVDSQIGNIESSLQSKAKLQEFEKFLKDSQAKWNGKLKTLPQSKEIQALGDRLGKVKTKDFKTPQELQQSLEQISQIVKEADEKVKGVQSLSNEFNSDFAELDKKYKETDAAVKEDIRSLETRFKLPKIDATSLSRGIFLQYLRPYLNMFYKYQTLAEKYVPPNLINKVKGNGSTPQNDEISIKPHPRSHGTTYEFGRANSYPIFWVKKILISSQAGTSPDSGNLKGLVTNLCSNQKLVGKPTEITIDGDFPSKEVQGLGAKVSIDATQDESLITYAFGIKSYPIENKSLLNSPEVGINLKKGYGQLNLIGKLVGLSKFSLTLENEFNKVTYDISGKNEMVSTIVGDVFKGIPVIRLSAKGEGELPELPLSIDSNLGPELAKGFEKQVQHRIDETKKKIQASIDSAIGKQKAQIDSEMSKFKAQYQDQIKKVNDQINGQKDQAQAKVESSKKSAETSAKKKIEEEGKKTLDDLKKKFGF